ncbi:Crp/Fnr family transcriptional regulator [Loktanella sp. DJP18]|uniref:Crp/Fnr family transcriptional regulator n=1 Tax=Loktanella sp. DJP18 TaxID=3409788 RepID=UPI003BB6634D
MSQSVQSAFLTRLSRILDLTVSERLALEDLEARTEDRRSHSEVFDSGRHDDRIAILRSGWATAQVHSDHDKITITHIYMAGDLIGFNDLGFASPPHVSVMHTVGSVAILSREKLFAMASDHPRVFNMMWALSNIETRVLQDRMHAIARFAAQDRLMHFILALKAKIDYASLLKSDRLPLPFSQREVGDSLGLTAVYVNRILRNLEKSGSLTRSRSYVKIHDWRTWEERVQFRNRYAEFDPRLVSASNK